MVTRNMEGQSNSSPRLAAVEPNESREPEAAPTAHERLLAQVRYIIQMAKERGERPPGRPTLVTLTGAKQHEVRWALNHLREKENDATRNVNGPARLPRSWPLLLVGLAGAVAIWTGWVELGRLTGFGVVRPLPGIWDSLRINSAVVLPISLEAYGSYALRCWLAPPVISRRTRRFAQRSAIASLVLGGSAQVICHLLKTAGANVAPTFVVVFVACVPVAVLGAAAALTRLVANDRHEIDQTAHAEKTPSQEPGPSTQ